MHENVNKKNAGKGGEAVFRGCKIFRPLSLSLSLSLSPSPSYSSLTNSLSLSVLPSRTTTLFRRHTHTYPVFGEASGVPAAVGQPVWRHHRAGTLILYFFTFFFTYSLLHLLLILFLALKQLKKEQHSLNLKKKEMSTTF